MNALAPNRLDELANEIRAERIASIVRVGKLLAEARELFRHDREEGGFTGWVEAQCEFSVTWAYQAINVFQRLGSEKFSEFGKLSQEALFALAAPSTPDEVVEQVHEQAAAGEKITAKEIRELRAKAKDVDKLRSDNEALQAERRRLNEKLSDLKEERDRAAEPNTITVHANDPAMERVFEGIVDLFRGLPGHYRERFYTMFNGPFAAPIYGDPVADSIDADSPSYSEEDEGDAGEAELDDSRAAGTNGRGAGGSADHVATHAENGGLHGGHRNGNGGGDQAVGGAAPAEAETAGGPSAAEDAESEADEADPFRGLKSLKNADPFPPSLDRRPLDKRGSA